MGRSSKSSPLFVCDASRGGRRLKRYRRNKGSPNHSAVKYESRASARDYILGLKHQLVWNQRSADQPLSSGFDGLAVICRFAQW